MIEKKTKLIPFDLERFEAGEYLKLQTRGGRRAVVTSVETLNERCPMNGYLIEGNLDLLYICWQKGGAALCEGIERDNDLMMIVEDVPESTPLDIPWHLIDKRWTRAAMDKSEEVWFFTHEAYYDLGTWSADDGSYILSMLVINTDGIIPELSLTKRPD